MNEYPYRKGVTAFVIDELINFLIVQKQNYGENQWDFPGGGLEDGEEPAEGVLRELKEELGSDNFEILKKSPFIIKFEWPKSSQEQAFAKQGKWWCGQEKYQFIVKFTGNKKELTLQEEEIRKIKWVPYKELQLHLVFDGQWEASNKVIEEAGLNH